MHFSKKTWFYIVFFTVLLILFYVFALKDYNFSASPLKVINPAVPAFNFTNQDGKSITQNDTDDKVYVANYFFTTCKGICPKMNANMRLVYDAYKNENDFMILSHTCMPETDSIPLMKKYEREMVGNMLVRNEDGSHSLSNLRSDRDAPNKNWHFVTGSKTDLYNMARVGYIIDNGKPDSTQNISDQFIHTQFFALVDRYRRVRGIYDGLKRDEVEKLIKDIKDLLKEKVDHTRFMTGFGNSPT
ncbi:MAG: SCO family protein [Ferruginibacter sp.]